MYAHSNIICPKDGSFERHRAIWLYLMSKTTIFTDDLKILHFVPLNIFQKKLRKLPNIKYISTDIKSKNVMINMNITEILFKENTFDVILCNYVLEHIYDDTKAMRELFRVLKRGGYTIITVPIDMKREKTFEDKRINTPEKRKEAFGCHNHVRIYGKDLKDR